MASAPESSRLPLARDDDDDDVAWALQTAMVEWKHGAIVDAVVWLRRAAEFAEQLGKTARAGEIAWAAGQIEASTMGAPAPIPALDSPASDRSRAIDDLLGVDEIDDADVADEEEIGDDDLAYESRPLPSFANSEFDEPLVGDEPPTTPGVPDELTEETTPLDLEPLEPVALDAAPDIQSRYSLLDEEETAQAYADEARQPASRAQVLDDEVDELDAGEPEEVAELDEPLSEPAAVLSKGDITPRTDIEGISLSDVTGFADLPEESHGELVQLARIEALGMDEEVSAFGVALVLAGKVSIMPVIADSACAQIAAGNVVFTRGSLSDGVALKAVALEDGTRVAVWEPGVVEDKLATSPWVLDELKVVADRLQALAGVGMGVLGERLDDSLRSMVTDRCQVKTLLPEEVLVTEKRPLGGLFVLGAGHLEVMSPGGAEVSGELGPGDILFVEQVLAAGPAPATVRAGKAGALVLFADRMAAHELMVSVPPLLEILAS
jgi:hypothetical protein